MALWGLASYALVLWWGGTALVWLLVRHRERPWASLWLLPLAGGLSLGVIDAAGAVPSVAASMLSFLGAIVLWGVLEAAHLYGWLTGPEKAPCPQRVTHLERFRRGINVGLHHDLGILVVVALLWTLLHDTPNPTAAWAFTVLWLMRWSAKLNLFLGVANFDAGLMPERMRYMASYMLQRTVNPLYPFSIAAGVLGTIYGALLLRSGLLSEAQYAGVALTTSLLVLGLFEHVLMMLPLRDSHLWRWVLAQTRESH
ncbi:MAG: putative photosynthetic complex assembly protein PuhE [Pseudomonadota bacterium]